MDLLSPIRRLLAARRTAERSQPADARIGWSPQTTAGVYITPERAMQNAVVWACVRYLSTAVAQLPWRVMRELPAGGAEIVKKHPVDTVLGWRPNPELSPFQFKETMVAWALLHGNGYAEIVRDRAGRVAELWPIHPDRIEVKRDTATDRLYYEVNDLVGGKIDMAPEDVFHLRGFGHGPVGLSVVQYAAQSIGWAQATELFGASFFGNGMNLGGFVKVSGKMSEGAKTRLLAMLKQRIGGPKKSNAWTVLDDEIMDLKPNTIAPNQGQFVESMQFQVEQVCRWFGVPPHKVMHLLRATFSNIEHQSIEVVVDAVSPWLKRLEEEADYKLFGANRAGFFTDLDDRALMRGDVKSRGEYYQMMRQAGAFCIDDILIAEGENPIGGDIGKMRVMQSQFATLERIWDGTASAKPDAPKPADPAPEPPPAAPAASAADMEAINAALTAALGVHVDAA